jgi:hypothetical protein
MPSVDEPLGSINNAIELLDSDTDSDDSTNNPTGTEQFPVLLLDSDEEDAEVSTESVADDSSCDSALRSPSRNGSSAKTCNAVNTLKRQQQLAPEQDNKKLCRMYDLTRDG